MKRTREPSHFLHQSLYDDEDDYSSSESGEFHRRKLHLKVKMPEEIGEDDNDSPQPLPPPQPQRKHFCVICDKQFSSGKAYGGHVRIHSSEYINKGKTKKMKMKKGKRKSGLVKKGKEIDLIRADGEGKIRCCLCGKEFQTIHSLFGHMRRHPDRSWKGIRPPPPEKFNLSFLEDDDDDCSDDDVMSRSMMMSDVTEDVQQAAYCLMLLAYTSSNYWPGRKKAFDDESPKSEVRSSSCVNGKEKVIDNGKRDDDGGMDDKGLVVDLKIKMEFEVKVNNPRDEEAKRSLGFDLNQPCQEYPYSSDFN